MSSTSRHRQHLTSSDLAMIGRVHKKVCAQNAMRDQSADAQRTAALLIREFQYGVNKEAELMTAFMGDGNFKLSVPVGRLSRFIGNALDQWESDDEVTALR